MASGDGTIRGNSKQISCSYPLEMIVHGCHRTKMLKNNTNNSYEGMFVTMVDEEISTILQATKLPPPAK